MPDKKQTPLTIHIIIENNLPKKEKQKISVRLGKENEIREFNRILRTQGNQKAMLFALRKGESVDSQNGTHLILAKRSVHWDLVG